MFIRFLNSSLETVFVLEDDVDWDIRLRSVQIPLAASAARTLLPPQRQLLLHPLTRIPQDRIQYRGNHNAWDLLYLGHCGDYFNAISRRGRPTTAP
jgi:hypothetical protein